MEGIQCLAKILKCLRRSIKDLSSQSSIPNKSSLVRVEVKGYAGHQPACIKEKPTVSAETNSEPRQWLTVLNLLAVDGLESFINHLALFLVAGPVFFLCLPYFSQSKLRGGVEQPKQRGSGRVLAIRLGVHLALLSVQHGSGVLLQIKELIL
eukprot:1143666-Pelagomonas_calceolata.AAC.1